MHRHTTPVNQQDGSVHNHHTWTRPNGHQIGAYANDTKWSSKVSSALGHVWSGIGTIALDKHLASKARRYKNQNNESTKIANVPILESLQEPDESSSVARYVEYINKNPPSLLSSAFNSSPAKELKETRAMKNRQNWLFGGDDQADWVRFHFKDRK